MVKTWLKTKGNNLSASCKSLLSQVGMLKMENDMILKSVKGVSSFNSLIP